MAVKATNQVDIVDLTDGYSVVMSSEAVSLVGGTTYANAATATTTAYAYCGSQQVACTVDATAVTFSGSHNSGITVSKDNNAMQPTLTFTVAASKVNGNCEATIPVVITDAGVTINKKFSFSVAKTGATGTRGAVWYSGDKITGTSTTATVFSNSGIASAIVGDMYLNTSTYNTYRCTVAGAASAAKWVYVNNVKGAKGDDPYTLSITSDNGTVLKNNTGQTTLTAHVYRAGAELTTMPSGHSVKWDVDGTLAETDSSLPATFTRTAAQVTNKCVVCAKLEG